MVQCTGGANIKIIIRNLLSVIIVSVLISLFLTVTSYNLDGQSDDLIRSFLFFAFPYSFLFVFLYGFIASIIGEIIAGLVQSKKGRLLVKITVYGISLSVFLFSAMEIKFFAYLGIVAAILYVVIDEYLRKRTNLTIMDLH